MFSLWWLPLPPSAEGGDRDQMYANLYLWGWKRNLFYREDMQEFLNKILIGLCFIYDIFFTWTGTQDELFIFFETLKQNEFNLKFTLDFHQESLNFLDITIFVNQDGNLGSTLFRKSTGGNSILHAGSSHPIQLLMSIAYSQYLRIRRNCSRDIDFEKEAKALQLRL